jgi:hypothetical protein
MFYIMMENTASAGDGPAPAQTLVSQEISDSARMRGALAACESLLGDCARVAVSDTATFGAQMMAAATAAKLATASALAASAIARLNEAETHRQLAAAKIELSLRPPAPSAPNARRASSARTTPAYDASDWRAYSDDDEESTNNQGEWPE